MFQIYRNVLDHKFCDYIAENYKKLFEYDPRGSWNAYTLKDKSLYDQILPNFSTLVPYEFKVNWINVTEYNVGRGLRSHLDENSSLTIVSEITENYKGGRFIINHDTYVELNKGDAIVFDGGKIYHGVEPVTEGQRLSLNLWTQKLHNTLL